MCCSWSLPFVVGCYYEHENPFNPGVNFHSASLGKQQALSVRGDGGSHVPDPARPSEGYKWVNTANNG
jgi:hypothetical protein